MLPAYQSGKIRISTPRNATPANKKAGVEEELYSEGVLAPLVSAADVCDILAGRRSGRG